MKLESQVVSLEFAKRLKQLGVKQESYFAWYHDREHFADNQLVYARDLRVERNVGESDLTYPTEFLAPAFTVAELGEALKRHEMECIWFEDKEQWGCFQTCDGHDPHYADTEADARAALLIYLLENKLITL